MAVGLVRSIVSWILEKATGDGIFATLLRMSKYSSVREFNDYAEQKKTYDELFYNEVHIYFGSLSIIFIGPLCVRYGIKSNSTASLPLFKLYPPCRMGKWSLDFTRCLVGLTANCGFVTAAAQR